MVIDVHVHICPPEVRKDREKFLDEEPGFAAIYKDPKAKLVGAWDLLQAMDEQGVNITVVFGFPWKKKEHFRLNNDYVLEAAKRYPGRLIPFCCLDPAHAEADKEIRRCLHHGAKGIGELAFYHKGLNPDVRRQLRSAAETGKEAGVPVLLHTNEPVGHKYPGKSPMNLEQIYALLKDYPEVRWILAHLGGGLPFYGFMKKEVREVLANTWFDIAALPFLYRPEAVKAAICALGTEKILFGTDYPLLPPSRYYQELAKSGLSQEELEAVYGRNAEKIFFS